MAGRVSDADKERVRDACRIDQVVAEYVALKPAGGGRLKGICPFHDEKSPSFTVSPGRGSGRFHCYGCRQGGDVFEFLMAIEHLTFVEAVQQLAERAGIALTLSEGGSSSNADRGSRSRLLAVNRATATFFAQQLDSDAAAAGRTYLTERGFDDAAVTRFGCGYAPDGWDGLVKHLLALNYTVEEMKKAGVARDGRMGPIDVFRRRLIWPIRDPAGEVVGFGARRLYDDDQLEAKYINTGETTLYHKSQVLFGLDLAKKDIATGRKVVVVEGYTDVMAMHLAGETTAIASCGTAFGEEHINLIRRYLLDSDVIRGEVIYIFDGDAAGRQAASKAFDSDQKFAANTYVCVAPDGMDPCELRQARGDSALRELVAGRKHLFEFAVRQTLAKYNLNAPEGRATALAAAIPMVAGIKRPDLREEFIRELAGWLGSETGTVAGRVRQEVASRARSKGQPAGRPHPPRTRPRPEPEPEPERPPSTDGHDRPSIEPELRRPDPRDRRRSGEREALKLVLQEPLLMAVGYRQVGSEWFVEPAYRRVHLAIAAAGGPARAVRSGPGPWVALVAEELPAGQLRLLVNELAVERFTHLSEPDPAYAGAILAGLGERVARAQETELESKLRRAEADGETGLITEIVAELREISAYRRALGDRAAGQS